MVKVRVRQHVNPLSSKYLNPVNTPNWNEIYAYPHQPLHLDIGCGWGRFLLNMSQLQPNWNFLGLEIRESLVEEANKKRDSLGLTNLYYLFGNANNFLAPLLSSFQDNTLQYVSIQFPDPWFKKRHQKRRVVQPELVENLANYLAVGGMVFIQSDIEEVAVEMRARFDAHSAFQRKHSEDWLENNPLAVCTERELSTISHNLPVYRALFTKIRLFSS